MKLRGAAYISRRTCQYWRDPYYSRKQNKKWRNAIDRYKARQVLDELEFKSLGLR